MVGGCGMTNAVRFPLAPSCTRTRTSSRFVGPWQRYAALIVPFCSLRDTVRRTWFPSPSSSWGLNRSGTLVCSASSWMGTWLVTFRT